MWGILLQASAALLPVKEFVVRAVWKAKNFQTWFVCGRLWGIIFRHWDFTPIVHLFLLTQQKRLFWSRFIIKEDVILVHIEFLSVEPNRRQVLTHSAQMEGQYMEIILPYKSHPTSLEQFRMTARSTVIVAFAVFHGLRSTRFRLACCSWCNVFLVFADVNHV